MQKSLKLASWFVAAGLMWLVGYGYNVYYGGELSWLRAMYQRKVAIAQQLEGSKRLIITGGSGAHYTVNAQLMEQALGIPVVNLGLDGPVGLDVILPSVLDVIRSGDTVLLIPEYLLLLDEDGLGDRSGQFGLAIGRPGLGQIPPQQLAQDILLLGIPTLRGMTKSTLDLIQTGQVTGYYDDPLTARGDPTVDKKRIGEWWRMNIRQSVSPHAIQRIHQFREALEGRQATLILSLPWVYANPNQETLRNVEKTAAKLSEIAPLLYDPSALNIQTDASLFGDTHYHLTAEGRNQRSMELVKQLQQVQAL